MRNGCGEKIEQKGDGGGTSIAVGLAGNVQEVRGDRDVKACFHDWRGVPRESSGCEESGPSLDGHLEHSKIYCGIALNFTSVARRSLLQGKKGPCSS